MTDKEEHKKQTEEKPTAKIECNDRLCPKHGEISLRGRSFSGSVIKKFPKRVVIEFERTVYVQKYERYAKRKTKLHARLPDCMANEINIGDYIEIMESRPISKIINFIVTKKITGGKIE
ncbi:MAG: 30S ribosomal protein S17 [Nanoarchaeota archaeon]|nr:30S ribosomal protein S17 [Nanoarchaeota archaeon]